MRAEPLAPPVRWSARARLGLALACLALASVPFAVVTFPPATDLPQHAAQVRLLAEAVTGDSDLYRVQWWTPYGLGYLVLGLARLALPPLAAARWGLAMLVWLWIAAVHFLAWRRGRSPLAAVLASLPAFSHVLYWGFVPFLAGWPLFVLWVLVTGREPDGERCGPGASEPTSRPRAGGWTRHLAAVFVFAAGLYLAHALWFAVAGLWLVVDGLCFRRRWRLLAARLAAVAPVVLFAAAWFAGLSRTSFATAPIWGVEVWRRLTLEWLSQAIFGGLRGPLEGLATAAVLLWVLAGMWSRRRELGAAVEPRLLALAGLLTLLALLAPDQYVNTIEFGDRWMPAAAVCLLLGAPSPRLLRRRARAMAAAGVLAVAALFCFATASVWRGFEREELAGLEAALEALPPGGDLLGLAYLRESPRIAVLPFIQVFAYGQVVEGGRLNFSFADFPTSLVTRSRRGRPPWTPGLEWFPQRMRRGDLRFFDHLLVGAPPEVHRRLAGDAALEAISTEAPWRLYRVRSEGPGDSPPARGVPLRPPGAP